MDRDRRTGSVERNDMVTDRHARDALAHRLDLRRYTE